MATDDFFNALSAAPYGVYAVDLNQTILFWNPSAERIVGYTAEQVIGYRCYQVLQSLPAEGSIPICWKAALLSSTQEQAITRR